MDIETFLLERNQTLYENEVKFNLTESGVHPCNIHDVLGSAEIDALVDIPLGYGYTEGRPGLRAAIASWYPGATVENVAVTHGASEANLLAILSILSKDDELLVILPNFMQMPGFARALGIRVVELRLREEHQWQLDLQDLERALTERTRMIALANPNNPTGQVMSIENMQALVAVAGRRKIPLLVDEIYRGAEINRPETPSFFGMGGDVIVTSSLSKAFAMPGLRLGWLVTRESRVAEVMRRQDYTTIGTSIMSQYMAERAMEPRKRHGLLARTRTILVHNVQLFDAWLARNQEFFSGHPPQAGAMAFLRYALPMTSEAFSVGLREEESVFVVAGSWFGVEGYIRVGLGGQEDHLRAALERIESFSKRQR